MAGVGQELVKVSRRQFHALFAHGLGVPILKSVFSRRCCIHNAYHLGTAWYACWRSVGLRDPGFLYILRRPLSGSTAFPRQIKHIVGLSFEHLTQTEGIAWEKALLLLSEQISNSWKAIQHAASGRWDLNIFSTGSIMRINEPFKMTNSHARTLFWNTAG